MSAQPDNAMKFIAKAGTPTYDKLIALRARMMECDQAANALRKSYGWDSNVLIPGGRVAGGIVGVLFEEAPKDWRCVHVQSNLGRFYYPIKGRKSTRKVLEELGALPIVGKQEYNRAIGADTPWSNFGLIAGPDFYLLEILESMEYDAPDLEEITTQRWKELKAELEQVHA